MPVEQVRVRIRPSHAAMYFLTAVLPLAAIFMAPLFVTYFDGPRAVFILIGALALLAATVSALCAVRVSVSVTADEIQIANGLRSRRVPLDDVASVTAGWAYPVMTLVTHNEQKIRIFAFPQTMLPDSRTADFLRVLSSRGIRVDDEIERLSRWKGSRLKTMAERRRGGA